MSKTKLKIEDLIAEYKAIRKKFGDDAKSSTVLIRNGHGKIFRKAAAIGMTWDEFKKECGFNDKPLQRHSLSFSDIVDEYKNIRKKHGEIAGNSKWMAKNGYMWLIHNIRSGNFSWNEFKNKCGFNDVINRTGLSLEDLIEEYSKIRAKYGNEARSSQWIQKNGYGWLYSQLSRKYKLTWPQFIKKCGFVEEAV